MLVPEEIFLSRVHLLPLSLLLHISGGQQYEAIEVVSECLLSIAKYGLSPASRARYTETSVHRRTEQSARVSCSLQIKYALFQPHACSRSSKPANKALV
jgi:hypothetical protein